MLAIVWVALLLVATALTGTVISGIMPRVIGATTGIGLGMTLAYGALSLEVADGAGVTAVSQPELAVIGLVVMVINAVYLFTGAVESIPSGMTGGR